METPIFRTPKGGSGKHIEAIILWRDESGAHANIPHKIKYHSPTGFEWGYGGSGPADLALNILLAIGLPESEARLLYQYFKWDFIAPMPKEGGVIEVSKIKKWIKLYSKD
jgi:hypothetical protein